MSCTHFIRAVIEMATFLGTSSDAIVEPDAAVSQLELLATILQEMDESHRREFITVVADMAKAEEKNAGKSARVEFLLSLSENLGLTAS